MKNRFDVSLVGRLDKIQNYNLLDLTSTNYDICIFTRVVITSTYLDLG